MMVGPDILIRSIVGRNLNDAERLAVADATLGAWRDFAQAFDPNEVVPAIMTETEALEWCSHYPTAGECIAYAVTHRTLYRLLSALQLRG